MSTTLLIITFIICSLFYFLSCSLREAMTWNGSEGEPINEGDYHLVRLGEWGSLYLAFLSLTGILGIGYVYILAGTALSGIAAYDWIFRYLRYDDPFFQRSWPYKLGSAEFGPIPEIIPIAIFVLGVIFAGIGISAL